jgi:hypothetical protein
VRSGWLLVWPLKKVVGWVAISWFSILTNQFLSPLYQIMGSAIRHCLSVEVEFELVLSWSQCDKGGREPSVG